MKPVNNILKYIVAVGLLLTLLSFENAYVSTSLDNRSSNAAFANTPMGTTKDTANHPDTVIVLRFAEGGWSNELNVTLWENTIGTLRNARRNDIDVVIHDDRHPAPKAALVLTAGETFFIDDFLKDTLSFTNK
jgi:hypothetical protein